MIRKRAAVPLIFVAAVAAFALYKPTACAALYLGTALYLAFVPAGLLADWRLDRRLPLAFLAYFLALLTATAVILAVPPSGRSPRN